MMAEIAELAANWGTRSIPFQLIREERPTLRVTVSPDGAVRAYAPLDAANDEVVARVSRRGGWIVRQLQRLEQWRPRRPERQYIGGETHLFLGRQYRLALRSAAPTGPHERASVYIDGDRLVLRVGAETSFEYRRALLRHWCSLQGHRYFPSRLSAILPLFQRFGVERPRLIIRQLSRRWGSFTPKGSLVLNSELVQASPHLIDYVIAHELAHAVHPNHGVDWQALLSDIMPDWRERKAALEQELL